MSEPRIEKKYAAAAAQAEERSRESLPYVERAVLAVAMQGEEGIGLFTRREVGIGWFQSLHARELCARIQTAFAAGDPVDPVSMQIALQEAGKKWGPKFVEEIVAMDVLPSHGEYYVDRLADAYSKRRVADAAAAASNAIEGGEESVDVTASKLAQSIAEIQEWKSRATEPTMHHMRLLRAGEFHRAAEDRAAGRPVKTRGLSWGIPTLDAVTDGIFPGLNVVAARPSFGKTMLENWISIHHLMEGRRVARACLDMTPQDLADRALTLLAGESLSKLVNGFMMRSDESKIIAAVEATKDWKEFLITEDTAEGIVSRARALKASEGLDLLTVDFIQNVRLADEAKFMNENMIISRATRIIKNFSIREKVPVVLLSQLSRAVEKEGRAPQLSDLRDSGSIEQDAKTVCFIYPEPTVVQNWTARAGIPDWKGLAIRPGLINCLKSQYGKTGVVGIRQIGQYGVYEAARRLTQEEISRDRAAHDAAALKREQSHRSFKAEVNRDAGSGFDFSQADTRCVYVVAKHPLGAYEVFDARFFDKLNAAAVRIGQEPWMRLEDVVGIGPALERRAAFRREKNQAFDAEAAEITNFAHLPVGGAPGANRAVTSDPASPFYEGGNPDPDEEVAP